MYRPRVRRDDGSTLVEVMVSVVLLAVLSTAVWGIVGTGTTTSAENKIRTAAQGLATREIEVAKAAIMEDPNWARSQLNIAAHNPTAVASDPNPADGLTVDGTTYQVTRTLLEYRPTNQTVCGNPDAAKAVLPVTIEVSVDWDSRRARVPVAKASAVMAPHRETASGLPPGKAMIAVAVKETDATGAVLPLAGVTMVAESVPPATGGASRSYTSRTDAFGCASFVVDADATGTDYEVWPQALAGRQDACAAAQPKVALTGVEPGKFVEDAITGLNRTASIDVTLLDSSDPSYDPSGQILWLESATCSTGLKFSETTDSAGLVRFADIPAGTYSVVLPGQPAFGTVALAPGASTTFTADLKP